MQRKDFRCTVIVRVNEGNVYFHSEGANDFQSHIDDLIKYCIRQLYLFLTPPSPSSINFFLSVFLLLLIPFSFSVQYDIHADPHSPIPFHPFSLSFIQFSSHTTPHSHTQLFPHLNSVLPKRVCKNCYKKNPIHT